MFGDYSNLKKEDSGNAVRELQKDLISLGFPLERYGIDGDYGPETEAAVRAFQSTYGLPATGIVTQAVANAIKNAIFTSKSEYTPSPTAYPASPLGPDAPVEPSEPSESRYVNIYRGQLPRTNNEPYYDEGGFMDSLKTYSPSTGESETIITEDVIDWKTVGLGLAGMVALTMIMKKRG